MRQQVFNTQKILLVNSPPVYRFLKRQVRWSGIPIFQNFPQFIVIYTIQGFDKVNKAEIDVFQQLELDMEQQTGSKYEKEYSKAVYGHPAYLTYMQSTS